MDERNSDFLHSRRGSNHNNDVLLCVYCPHRQRQQSHIIHDFHHLRCYLSLHLMYVSPHVPRHSQVSLPRRRFSSIASDKADRGSCVFVSLDGYDDCEFCRDARDSSWRENIVGFGSIYFARGGSCWDVRCSSVSGAT